MKVFFFDDNHYKIENIFPFFFLPVNRGFSTSELASQSSSLHKNKICW